MRRILFSLLFLVFNSSSVFSATWDNLQFFKWPTCNIPKNEWRFGVGIGIEYLSLSTSVKQKFPFGAIYFGNQDQTQKHFQFSPSIEVGKEIFNDYYLGIITSWHYSNSTKKSRAPLRNAAYFKNAFKMSYYINIFAKLGYKIASKTMVYALIGPSLAKWSHTTNQLEYDFDINQEIKKDSFKLSGTSAGVGMGIGLEQIICKSLALSINYTYHTYKGRSGKKQMSYLDNIPEEPRDFTGISSKKITPSSSAIVMRVAYFF